MNTGVNTELLETTGSVVCVVWRRLPALDGHRAACEEFATLAEAERWCSALRAVGVPAWIVTLAAGAVVD